MDKDVCRPESPACGRKRDHRSSNRRKYDPLLAGSTIGLVSLGSFTLSDIRPPFQKKIMGRSLLFP
jgi:hypothetical protein